MSEQGPPEWNADGSSPTDWQEIMILAAWGLALTPEGIEKVLARHHGRPDGTCSECGQRLPCRLARIAVAARVLKTNTKHPARKPTRSNGAPAPSAVWDAIFDIDPTAGTVPPVLGIEDEHP